MKRFITSLFFSFLFLYAYSQQYGDSATKLGLQKVALYCVFSNGISANTKTLVAAEAITALSKNTSFEVSDRTDEFSREMPRNISNDTAAKISQEEIIKLTKKIRYDLVIVVRMLQMSNQALYLQTMEFDANRGILVNSVATLFPNSLVAITQVLCYNIQKMTRHSMPLKLANSRVWVGGAYGLIKHWSYARLEFTVPSNVLMDSTVKNLYVRILDKTGLDISQVGVFSSTEKSKLPYAFVESCILSEKGGFITGVRHIIKPMPALGSRVEVYCDGILVGEGDCY